MGHSVRNGEYVTIGEFFATRDEEEQMWIVSRVSNLTHNSMTLTTIGKFSDKEVAIAAMRRKGLHLVKA